jgi:hypothetical protein
MNFAETRGSEGLWCWPSFCHNFLAFIWNAQLINFWRIWISLDFPSSRTVNNADCKRKITVQSLVYNFLPKDDSTSIVLGLFDQRQWRKIGVHGKCSHQTMKQASTQVIFCQVTSTTKQAILDSRPQYIPRAIKTRVS